MEIIVNTDTLNMLRSLVTVCAFASFIGIVLWAWSGQRRVEFEQAARMPLDEEENQSMEAGSQVSARVERSSK